MRHFHRAPHQAREEGRVEADEVGYTSMTWRTLLQRISFVSNHIRRRRRACPSEPEAKRAKIIGVAATKPSHDREKRPRASPNRKPPAYLTRTRGRERLLRSRQSKPLFATELQRGCGTMRR